MAGDLREPRPASARNAASWQDVLDELEHALRDASRAIVKLRQTLEAGDEPQAPSPVRRALEPVRGSDEPQTAAPAAGAFGPLDMSSLRASIRPQGPDKVAADPQDEVSSLRAAMHPKGPDNGAGDSHDADADAELDLSPTERSARLSAFEKVWERIERERAGADEQAGEEQAAEEQDVEEPVELAKERHGLDLVPEQDVEEPAESVNERRGLDLLPQQYLITVEDKDSRVDLAPLHRALLTLVNQDDIALVSFANGVPVISVRAEGQLDMEQLKEAVAAATNRDCEVVPQEGGRIFLRLAPAEEES